MDLNFKAIQEFIKLKPHKLKIKVVTVSGKDGDHFVIVAPAILVSGYGLTEDEAKESFSENINLFCSDLMALSKTARDLELKKLGFIKEKLFQRNFSKAYVDENGILQGIEHKVLQTLEATI